MRATGIAPRRRAPVRGHPTRLSNAAVQTQHQASQSAAGKRRSARRFPALRAGSLRGVPNAASALGCEWLAQCCACSAAVLQLDSGNRWSAPTLSRDAPGVTRATGESHRRETSGRGRNPRLRPTAPWRGDGGPIEVAPRAVHRTMSRRRGFAEDWGSSGGPRCARRAAWLRRFRIKSPYLPATGAGPFSAVVTSASGRR